jgi:hypothetical protein
MLNRGLDIAKYHLDVKCGFFVEFLVEVAKATSHFLVCVCVLQLFFIVMHIYFYCTHSPSTYHLRVTRSSCQILFHFEDSTILDKIIIKE